MHFLFNYLEMTEQKVYKTFKMGKSQAKGPHAFPIVPCSIIKW